MDRFSEIWEKINEIDERVKRLEKSNQEGTTNNINLSKATEIEKRIALNLKKFQTKELVLIALRLFSPKTSSEIKNRLKNWGWVEDTFFTKNFSTLLIKTGLVQKENDENGKNDILTLTLKGEIETDKIIEKYRLS